MGAIIQSAADMFEELLFEVNKEETAAIWPRQAVWLFNRASFLWLKEQAKLVDLRQKNIDDVSDCRGKTTNAVFINGRFNLTTGLTRYYRLLMIMVKISDLDDCIDNDEWQQVHIMKSDKRSQIMNSPYRKPGVNKLYYDIIGNYLYIYGGTPTTGWIEYLQYMIEITDVDGASPTDVSDYTDGMLREVISIAARIYLRRHENPEYQTILTEMAIEKQFD
jgi:hypothetical protein